MTTPQTETEGPMPNGFDPASVEALQRELRSFIERRQSVIAPSNRLFYSTPVDVVRAEGVHSYDAQGNR